MRHRICLAVLMMSLCLLCACGGKESEPIQAPMDFRRELLTRGGCAMELEARAESGNLVWELTLDCSLDPTGKGSVTVLAPESIAGVTALVDERGGSLRYGDLALGLGLLPGTELAPAAAPGKLVRAWAQAWIASAGEEDPGSMARYEDGRFTVSTWFDENRAPRRAELAVDGKLCFAAEIRKFEWKAIESNETTEENLG